MSTKTILDTSQVLTGGVSTEIGPTNGVGDSSQRGPLWQFDCDLASGDVVVIEARASEAQAWKEVLRFTESGIFDLSTASQLRARRITDGGIGDSIVVLDDKGGLT